MAGTIEKRGDGTYRLWVSMGSDASGNPRRFSKTVHVVSKKEAEKALAEFYLECEKRKDSGMLDCTVEVFANLWWDEHVSHFTKISTRSGYRAALYQHIIPELGAIRLVELRPLQIQRWVNEMSDGGLSSKTVKNYYSVLNSLCEFGVKWEYLQANPCRKVTLPKQTRHEARYYSEAEVHKLIAALEDAPKEDMNYTVAVYIGLFGGLRKGEILGLNEDDYIRKRRELRIIRTRMLGNGIGPYVDTPKTETSVRIITIPQEIAAKIDALLEYQAEQKRFWGRKWADSEALIKGRTGQAMYPQNLQRWFTRFIKKNHLPPLTLHGLRHTHTALLVSITDDIAQISHRLGHSEITTTLNIYTHLFRDNDKMLADEMAEAILRNDDNEGEADEEQNDDSRKTTDGK